MLGNVRPSAWEEKNRFSLTETGIYILKKNIQTMNYLEYSP